MSAINSLGDRLCFIIDGQKGVLLTADRSKYDLGMLDELDQEWRDVIITSHLANVRHKGIGYFAGIDWISEERRQEAFFWLVDYRFQQASNDQFSQRKPVHYTWIEEALETAAKRGWAVPEHWAVQTGYRYGDLVREHLFSKPWTINKYDHYTDIKSS